MPQVPQAPIYFAPFTGASSASFTMIWVTVLVAHDEHPDTRVCALVNDAVREAVQRERRSADPGRRTQPRLGSQQTSDSVELVKKTHHNPTTCSHSVAAACLIEIAVSARMKAISHPYFARSAATADGPSTSLTSPLSISASRWAARASQAWSLAMSWSKLRISRSNNRARSAGASLRAWASITAKSVCMSRSPGWQKVVACHKPFSPPGRTACPARPAC